MVICQFVLYLSSSNIFQFIAFHYCILDVHFRKKHSKSHENQVKVLVLRIGQIKEIKTTTVNTHHVRSLLIFYQKLPFLSFERLILQDNYQVNFKYKSLRQLYILKLPIMKKCHRLQDLMILFKRSKEFYVCLIKQQCFSYKKIKSVLCKNLNIKESLKNSKA